VNDIGDSQVSKDHKSADPPSPVSASGARDLLSPLCAARSAYAFCTRRTGGAAASRRGLPGAALRRRKSLCHSRKARDSHDS
jgi:hypothetical protein